jgi:hypothetical protein
MGGIKNIFMNLDQNVLSNPIKSYLIVLGVLIISLFIKRLISRFFARLIYTWIDKKIILN